MQWLLAFIVLVLIAAQLWYVWKVRTGVPHQDDWTGLDDMFRARDSHHVLEWLFSTRNGHFGVPAGLGYLTALSFFSLDLTPLRFAGFFICLASFALVVRVIRTELTSRARRHYVYLGAAFLIFNLCFWEHFTQAGAYGALLCLLLSSTGIYHACRVARSNTDIGREVSISVLFLVAAIVSFGAGYIGVGAAGAIAMLDVARRHAPKPWYGRCAA